MDPLGVTVLGVSVDYDAQALGKFVTRSGIRFPIVQDKDQRVASRYGTFKYPETYIIDQEGKVTEKLIGPKNWQEPGIVTRVRNLAAARR
jgi:peroxiredoxin